MQKCHFHLYEQKAHGGRPTAGIETASKEIDSVIRNEVWSRHRKVREAPTYHTIVAIIWTFSFTFSVIADCRFTPTESLVSVRQS